MKSVLVPVGIVLVVCLVGLSLAAKKQDGPNEQGRKPADSKLSPEQTAIRNNAQAFVDAFNVADARAVASLFAPDGQMSVDGETIAEGRKAIEEAYAGFFKENPQVRISVTIDSIRLLGPNLAIEKGTSQSTSEEVPVVDGYTMVHVRRGGEWLTATAEVIQRPVVPQFNWKTELGFLGNRPRTLSRSVVSERT